MFFGEVGLDEAEGAILAHSVLQDSGRFRKGMILTDTVLAALNQAGVTRLTIARPEPGDVGEDEAAARLALALVPDPTAARLAVSTAFTGRVNLNAIGPGIVELDAEAVHRLNRIDPAITLATLAPFTRVHKGLLVGTVKIISYAVSEGALQQACALAQRAVRIAPVTLRGATLILTDVPGMPEKLAEKSRGAIKGRLDVLGMTLDDCRSVPHEEAALATAIAEAKSDIILILTGSATSDLYDTAPQGLRRAGGTVARFGMPVDPGNLLFHGHYQGRPVIGLPGCSRSPALNGADWVLERLACGFSLSDDDIAAMGVGGLLKEIPIRPQPREAR